MTTNGYWPNFFTYLRIVTFSNQLKKSVFTVGCFRFSAMLSAGSYRKKKKQSTSPNAQTRSRWQQTNVNANGTGYNGRFELSFEQSLHPVTCVLLLQNWIWSYSAVLTLWLLSGKIRPALSTVPSTPCDVITFNGQEQLCPLTCAGRRDLSNYTRMSTI